MLYGIIKENKTIEILATNAGGVYHAANKI